METLEAYLDRKHEELTSLNGFLGTPLALRHPATKIAPGSGSLVGDGDFGVLHDHRRETGRSRHASRLPSPLIDKAGATVRAPSHLRHHGPGLFNRRQNLRALF